MSYLPSPEPSRTVQPHEDESLPPQLREALRIMSKCGRVVEITAAQVLARRKEGL